MECRLRRRPPPNLAYVMLLDKRLRAASVLAANALFRGEVAGGSVLTVRTLRSIVALQPLLELEEDT